MLVVIWSASNKKYRGIAQQQIKAKLVEADQIIADIAKMSARNLKDI